MKPNDNSKAHALTISFFLIIVSIVILMIAFPVFIFIVLGMIFVSMFYSIILKIAKEAVRDAND